MAKKQVIFNDISQQQKELTEAFQEIKEELKLLNQLQMNPSHLFFSLDKDFPQRLSIFRVTVIALGDKIEKADTPEQLKSAKIHLKECIDLLKELKNDTAPTKAEEEKLTNKPGS